MVRTHAPSLEDAYLEILRDDGDVTVAVEEGA
jgi:hypothetical protein